MGCVPRSSEPWRGRGMEGHGGTSDTAGDAPEKVPRLLALSSQESVERWLKEGKEIVLFSRVCMCVSIFYFKFKLKKKEQKQKKTKTNNLQLLKQPFLSLCAFCWDRRFLKADRALGFPASDPRYCHPKQMYSPRPTPGETLAGFPSQRGQCAGRWSHSCQRCTSFHPLHQTR